MKVVEICTDHLAESFQPKKIGLHNYSEFLVLF